MKAFRTFLTGVCLTAAALQPLSAQAQTESDASLLLHYDFENVTGTTVPDQSASGQDATLVSPATVVEMGKYHALSLGSGSGYLNMGAGAGQLVRELGDYSVSVYYYVDSDASLSGAGYFLWSFSQSDANTASSAPYMAYRLNAQRMATSTGGYSNESGIEVGSESAKGRWIHVLYRQSGTSGQLYIDGESVGANASMPTLSTAFTAAPAYNWIGRAPFTTDSYLQRTYVADFRLYGCAVSDSLIAELAARTDTIEYEFLYGMQGDFTALAAAVAKGQELVSGQSASYPAAALLIYQDALTRAQQLVSEGRVSQTLIDNELESLQNAQAALEATAGFVFEGGVEGMAYDTDRGFRHPGGLHTAADFERIRRQIAEGNEKVVSAYKVLKSAEYAQASAATYPVETIVRGSGSQNYINAARGATIAYQNGLRWQIDSTRVCAQHAVDVLMQWARTCKYISGNSNYALAAGIYGYQFAQAAELVRDYDGWSAEDFNTFKQWMLDVWYPSALGFLRARNGTWENSAQWWEAPGHYWSNWGLCNALCLISIGVLCDDPFIYNQGMSFFKYDQVGTFTDPRTDNPIRNDGLTEFLGNLVVTTSESELETGAYGRLGQMQESGRDIGHATMAAGLAIDIAQVGWNQGDDLFSYMDHRLAAGLEYVAAQTQSVADLPWTDYLYGTNGIYYTDSRCWRMTGPALGEQIRPYWATVIGHYEGVKGVTMPFSEVACEKMGIDAGGTGGTSGSYDHLGYSVLTHTMDGLAAPEQVPTELSPIMEYNGLSVAHNELGGLTNTYKVAPSCALAAGTVVTLRPQLPDGETDTGLWEWNTGETTRDLTIAADRSGLWRVTYTNARGVKSELVFSIAVAGDCVPSTLHGYMSANGGESVETDSMTVFYGSSVTLALNGVSGWGYYEWANGSTASSITLPYVTSTRDVTGVFISQGGRRQAISFHIEVVDVRPDITVGNTVYEDTLLAVVSAGDEVTLSVTTSGEFADETFLWSDGSTEASLRLADVQTSGSYTLRYTRQGISTTLTYQVYVADDAIHKIADGDYYIRHVASDRYLTNGGLGEGTQPTFQPLQEGDDASAQRWHATCSSVGRFTLFSVADSLYLSSTGELTSHTQLKRWTLRGASGIDYLAWFNYGSTSTYVQTLDDGTADWTSLTVLSAFPYEFIPAGQLTAISAPHAEPAQSAARGIYDLSGRRQDRLGAPGLYIIDGKKVLVK